MNEKQNSEVRSIVPMEKVDGGGAVALVPQNMGEVMEFAKLMAHAKGAIPQGFVNNPGACLAVTTSALRFGMDPFAVAQKAYMVNNQIAYEAQLVAALINTRAPIKGRPAYTYDGQGQNRTCTVKVTTTDGQELEYTTPPLSRIKKKSPLWVTDPDQQLAYFAIRSLARRYFPEVILGVYDKDELEGDAVRGAPDATGGDGANPLIEAEVVEEDDEMEDEPDISIEIEDDDDPLAEMLPEAPENVEEAEVVQDIPDDPAFVMRVGDSRLIDAARAAAGDGVDVFRGFWHDLTPEQRAALEPHLDELRKIAGVEGGGK